MEFCFDFVEWLGPDTASSVLVLLEDPADLVRVSAVSRSWRRFVIENSLCKSFCSRICSEASNFTRVIEISSIQMSEVGTSSNAERRSLEREHRVYSYLSHRMASPVATRDCTRESIRASSTDNFPDECIENTLEPSDRVDMRPSYWSSEGQKNPEAPETLTYSLVSKLCVINEVKIQPFEAYFQYGNPIYSAKSVRFRMGYRASPPETSKDGQVNAGDDYKWIYVSPKFQMLQENSLQSFKLPRPVLCIGGILQIELLGRVQAQETDALYYIWRSYYVRQMASRSHLSRPDLYRCRSERLVRICTDPWTAEILTHTVCHVQVLGYPLTPLLDAEIGATGDEVILKHLPEAGLCSSSPEARDSSSWQTLKERIKHLRARARDGWHHPFFSTLLGALESDLDDEEPPPLGYW